MLRVGLRAAEAVLRRSACEALPVKSLEVAARTAARAQAAAVTYHPPPYAFRLYSSVGRCRGDDDIHQEISPGKLLSGDQTPPASHPAIRHLAASAWVRHAHTRSKRRRDIISQQTRFKSTATDPRPRAPSNTSAPKAELSPENKNPPPATPDPATPDPATPKENNAPPHEDHYSILDRLPHLPSIHRPTKDELLAAATSAWSRFKIHFKWFSIRSFRPWNVDDISAFFTWIIAGHIVWIIVGTTTFFSLLIWMVNTAFTQERLAGWVGNYLTQSSGVQVIFESAVVPKWGDGVISFGNVFVSRRPGQGKSRVKKGSQAEAAAAAAREGRAVDGATTADDEDDGNYTQFDVSMDTVNVTLSFTKWFNGKGLLRDVEIKGIRGVIDRSHVDSTAWEGVDPASWKHEHHTGDFELDSFKMEDMLVTVYQPENFRPFSVSIHLCELPRLRKQWLFYDFLSANVMHGSYDNAMFAIHPRQEHNFTGSARHAPINNTEEALPWKKHARFRIDGLSIDHMNRGVEGMFSWIKEGKVDIVADMMFPGDEEGIAKVMSDFYDRVEATVTSSARGLPVQAGTALREGGYAGALPQIMVEAPEEDAISIPAEDGEGQPLHQGGDPPVLDAEVARSAPSKPRQDKTDQDRDNRFMVMDVRVQLSDVRATVPFFTQDISYMNNALIRPIVAYINSRRAFIPVNCRVVKSMDDFDGSWSAWDSGLLGDLQREVYEAFARDVLDDDQLRRRRFKKVGVWTLQLAAQALFIGLAGNIA